MKKVIWIPALIIVILLTSMMATAYYVSVNHGTPKQTPMLTPAPTAVPTEAPSPSPTPPQAAPPSTTPPPTTTDGSFPGPLGYFTISSPTGTTPNINPVTLSVTGGVLFAGNTQLTMNYRLDNQPSLPLPIQLTPQDPNAHIFTTGIINGFVNLSQLPDGPHTITVYAELSFAGTSSVYYSQETVNFTVQ